MLRLRQIDVNQALLILLSSFLSFTFLKGISLLFKNQECVITARLRRLVSHSQQFRRSIVCFKQNRCTDFFNKRTAIRKIENRTCKKSKSTHAQHMQITQQVRFATPVPNSS